MLVAEGLEWKHIYFVRGAVPKYSQHANAIKDPSNAGWTLAFIITGDKRSTVFNPYSLQAWTVRNDCLEVATATEPPQEFRPDFVRRLMEERWAQFQGYGYQRDYDTCALVMRRLGWPVPAEVLTGGGEDTRKKGGKDVSSKLLKPVKASGKRGKFLAWFLTDGGSHAVREAMAEFSMTRSNVLSYLYMLKKDHGIGYELVGDVATVQLPDGCDDPFDESAAPPPPSAAEEPDDDSWLD